MLVNVLAATFESVVGARRATRRTKAKEAYEARVELAKAAEAEAEALGLAVGVARDQKYRGLLFARASKA